MRLNDRGSFNVHERWYNVNIKILWTLEGGFVRTQRTPPRSAPAWCTLTNSYESHIHWPKHNNGSDVEFRGTSPDKGQPLLWLLRHQAADHKMKSQKKIDRQIASVKRQARKATCWRGEPWPQLGLPAYWSAPRRAFHQKSHLVGNCQEENQRQASSSK